MNSRYDMMQAGVSIDPNDGQSYPDTLRVNYNNFKFRDPPTQVAPNDQLQAAPYLFTFSYYGNTDYDDIILNINSVLHISLLYNASIVKFPSRSDIIYFMRNNQG